MGETASHSFKTQLKGQKQTVKEVKGILASYLTQHSNGQTARGNWGQLIPKHPSCLKLLLCLWLTGSSGPSTQS